MRFFERIEEGPRHCSTMGVATIMDCRQILLFAFGEGKADIIAKAIEGPVSAMVPASVLQMHPDVKIFIDDAAASRLKHRDYYSEVFAGKPSWQSF